MKTAAPTLTISFLDDKLVIGDVIINLEPRTIYHGIIFKPSEIANKLSTYIKTTKLKKPKVTVCLPTITNKTTQTLPFFVLQYTLILAKTGVTITKVTEADHTTNLLSLLQPVSARSPKLWLFSTLIAFCSLGITMWIKYQEATAHYIKLNNQQAVCKLTNTDYEKQYNDMNSLKKIIKQLEEKHTATQDILQKRHNPAVLLNTLAHQTTTSIWLTEVTFNKKTENKQQKEKTIKQAQIKPNLSIKGTSLNTKAVSQFLKNLSDKTTGIHHPAIVHVSKEKTKQRAQTKKLYHFVIEGTFNP